MPERAKIVAGIAPQPAASLRQRLAAAWRSFIRSAIRTGRLMNGIPDYDTYVVHCRLHHPERTPMTYEQFFRNRLAARYAGGGRSGCC